MSKTAKREGTPFRLTVDIDVALNGLKQTDMLAELQAAAKYLFDEGLITGETPAEVVRWTTEVCANPPDVITEDQERSQLYNVVRELVETINATGGVFTDRKGLVCPKGDEAWCDLGSVYLKACAALKRRAKHDRNYHGETP